MRKVHGAQCVRHSLGFVMDPLKLLRLVTRTRSTYLRFIIRAQVGNTVNFVGGGNMKQTKAGVGGRSWTINDDGATRSLIMRLTFAKHHP